MASPETLPKIPTGSEYVACPECKRLGWRQFGTDLLCPDCDVSAVRVDDPDDIGDGITFECPTCNGAGTVYDLP